MSWWNFLFVFLPLSTTFACPSLGHHTPFRQGGVFCDIVVLDETFIVLYIYNYPRTISLDSSVLYSHTPMIYLQPRYLSTYLCLLLFRNVLSLYIRGKAYSKQIIRE